MEGPDDSRVSPAVIVRSGGRLNRSLAERDRSGSGGDGANRQEQVKRTRAIESFARVTNFFRSPSRTARSKAESRVSKNSLLEKMETVVLSPSAARNWSIGSDHHSLSSRLVTDRACALTPRNRFATIAPRLRSNATRRTPNDTHLRASWTLLRALAGSRCDDRSRVWVEGAIHRELASCRADVFVELTDFSIERW